jgi:hypothetical protein
MEVIIPTLFNPPSFTPCGLASHCLPDSNEIKSLTETSRFSTASDIT